MSLPSRSGPTNQAFKLCLSFERIGNGVPLDRRLPSRPVERVQIFRHRAADLPQYVDVAAQGRNAQGKGFGKRKPESLVEGGKKQCTGAFEKACHPIIGRQILLMHKRTQHWRPFQHIDDVFVFPTPRTNDDKMRSSIAMLGAKYSPYIEDQQVILARLDGADHYEIRGSHWRL